MYACMYVTVHIQKSHIIVRFSERQCTKKAHWGEKSNFQSNLQLNDNFEGSSTMLNIF